MEGEAHCHPKVPSFRQHLFSNDELGRRTVLALNSRKTKVAVDRSHECLCWALYLSRCCKVIICIELSIMIMKLKHKIKRGTLHSRKE